MNDIATDMDFMLCSSTAGKITSDEKRMQKYQAMITNSVSSEVRKNPMKAFEKMLANSIVKCMQKVAALGQADKRKMMFSMLPGKESKDLDSLVIFDTLIVEDPNRSIELTPNESKMLKKIKDLQKKYENGEMDDMHSKTEDMTKMLEDKLSMLDGNKFYNILIVVVVVMVIGAFIIIAFVFKDKGEVQYSQELLQFAGKVEIKKNQLELEKKQIKAMRKYLEDALNLGESDQEQSEEIEEEDGRERS